MLRANKLLVSLGAARSRVAADAILLNKRVTYLGEVVHPGMRLSPASQLFLDGQPLPPLKEDLSPLYIAFHKPPGYLTSWSEKDRRPSLLDALRHRGGPVPPHLSRLMHAGRLDFASEGLLLLSTDGYFCQRVCHPKFDTKKRYVVGAVATGGLKSVTHLLQHLETGVTLSCDPRDSESRSLYETRPARALEARELSPSEAALYTWRGVPQATKYFFDVVINEGRKRVVRRMFGALGWKVQTLVRTEVGGVKLGGLEQGGWRELTHKEVALF